MVTAVVVRGDFWKILKEHSCSVELARDFSAVEVQTVGG